jgi:hypothetical protein
VLVLHPVGRIDNLTSAEFQARLLNAAPGERGARQNLRCVGRRAGARSRNAAGDQRLHRPGAAMADAGEDTTATIERVRSRADSRVPRPL